MTQSHPPVPARWLVTRVVSAAKRADVLAALQHEFADRTSRHGPSAARRWYWRQALAFLSRTAGERLRGRRPAGIRRAGASRLSPGLGHDIRYAVRTLRRSPVVSLAAITSLALGIGANTAFFSLVERLLLNPLPLVKSQRLAAVFNAGPTAPYSSFTYADYVDYRDGTSEAFDQLAAYFESEFTISGSVRPEVVHGALVSWNYFHALGVSPATGRFFTPEEGESPGIHPVVVVSHEFWRTRLGGAAAIGSSISVNGAPFTLIGVAPRGFRGSLVTSRNDVWVPLMMYNEVATGFFATIKAIDYRIQRTGGRIRFLRLIARMRHGVSLDRGQAALDIVSSRLAADYPDTNGDRVARAVPLRVAALPMSDRSDVVLFLSLLIGAVGLVLIIACANVANLLLVRAEQRRREVGIRIALGAGRRRLMRQWLAESLLMAVLAGAVGLAFAALVLRALAPFTLPGGVPAVASVHFSWPTFAFTTGISIITGVVFGLAPALHTARADVRTALSSGPRAGDRSARLRSLLVAAQVGLSVVLVVGAGLFVRSMLRVLNSDLGFASDGLVTLNVDLGSTGYDESRALAFYDRFAAEARAIPGVSSVTITDAPFGTSALSVNTVWTPDSAVALDVDDVLLVNVAPSYFRTFDVPIIEGRPLDPAAQSDAWVLVVNQAFRTRVWGESAAVVGRHFQFSEPDDGNLDDLAEVVGVAGDTRQYGLDDSPLITYRSVREYPGALLRWPMALVARTTADPNRTLGALRELIRRIDPDLPVTDQTTVSERVGRAAMPQRMGLVLLSGLAVVALLVAAIGVYAAVSYSLAQRRREIGIRVALGATPSRVAGLVLRLGIAPALIGIGAGLIITLFASRLLRAFLFGVSPADPLTFVTTAALLILVAAGASVVPARRGAQADPVQALRED